MLVFDRLLGASGLSRRHRQVLSALQPGPLTVEQLDAKLALFLDRREPTARPALDDLAANLGWVDPAGERPR